MMTFAHVIKSHLAKSSSFRRARAACPQGVGGVVLLRGIIQTQCLGALGDKVLRIAVNQADHGALHVETPCYKLSMRREDRVGARDFGGDD